MNAITIMDNEKKISKVSYLEKGRRSKGVIAVVWCCRPNDGDFGIS